MSSPTDHLATATAPVPTEPQASAPAEPQPPPSARVGNGKVARLTKVLRDQVNQMLLDHVPFLTIIESLGDAGKGINEDNIGSWKKYGFKLWCRELDRREALRLSRDAAKDLLAEKAGPPLQEAARSVAAGQLYELLSCFDPNTFAQSLADKPELYLRLVNTISRLSVGDANCDHRRTQDSLLQAKLHPAQTQEGRLVLTEETLKDIARRIKLL